MLIIKTESLREDYMALKCFSKNAAKISPHIWYVKKVKNTDRPYRYGAPLKNFAILKVLPPVYYGPLPS